MNSAHNKIDVSHHPSTCCPVIRNFALVVGSVFALGVVCLVALTLVSGCKPSEAKKADAELTVAKKPVSFLVSCDTNGWIVPCGCSTKQSGGLLRRGTLVNNLQADGPVVVLDVGGASAGNSEYHRVKFEAILKGELSMGIAAHNIGASEARWGADVLREIGRNLSVPFVSANVFDANNALVAKPLQLVEQGGQRFAIIGVLDPQFRADDLVVQDPREAILDLLDRSQEKFDGIVVLAYLEREALFELAKQLPEVDVVIGGPTVQTIPPTRVGATLITSVTNKGKFVAQLNCDFAATQPWSGTIVEVDDSLADDSAQLRNLTEYHDALAERDFASNQTGLSDRTLVSFDAEVEFAGNESCKKCHADDCSHFVTTKHAIAWQTLELKNSHVDPYCQQCHTTGYGTPSGFFSMAKSSAMFNVGCESCHGPSRAHVDDPNTRTVFFAKDQCTSCHDRENSPAFEYDGYWQKIIHGKAAK